jgi:predicted amidohydrolase
MPDGAVSAGDRTVRIRCHELAPVIGDQDGNLRAVDDAISDAMAAGSELLVLPELATSGYHLTPAEADAAALRASSEVFERWARLLRPDAVLVVGFAEAADDAVYNSVAVLVERGLLAVYRKTHLWDTEKEIFRPGDVAGGVLDTPVGPLGTLVCYDLEFPEMPRRLALAGAEILAVPTNWPVVPKPPGEHPPEVVQAMAAARASQVVIACCDRRGEERGESWTQGTVVVGADGWLRGEKDAQGRLDVAVELSARRRVLSTRNDAYLDRRPDLYL